ncbi:hypothetical protein C3K47_11435 [Solitalea longa]|uniref:Uncharacterized protein n=1 Tax=Solitalea longa TaxID=2079460 RepID=A0A2S5A258_9SPHI|nr:hypothetical protein [Solitalea longa]POY36352.1 hypothetical protein C3K47_11435 [Solitalea longa]
MKKSLYITLTALILSVTINSCSKNEEADTQTCDISAESYITNSEGTVTYTVTASGDNSSISSISYTGADGAVTVNNPNTSFSQSVNVHKGTMINLNAKGTAIKGQLRASYVFTGNGGAELKESLKVCPGE